MSNEFKENYQTNHRLLFKPGIHLLTSPQPFFKGFKAEKKKFILHFYSKQKNDWRISLIFAGLTLLRNSD